MNTGKVPLGIHNIVQGNMIALWPTDDISNNDESFWIADVLEKNIFTLTVHVVPWVLDEDSQDGKYVRQHPNMNALTVAFRHIFLYGFALTKTNMITKATKTIINSIITS